MTDNEIIKALACCEKDDCDNCPNDFGNCYSNLAGYALDLINRQKEEIERLCSVVDKTDAEVGALLEKLNAAIVGQETLQKHIADKNEDIDWARKRILEADKTISKQNAKIDRLKSLLNEKAFELAEDGKNEIKAEAIKEFAERLKERFFALEYRANTTRKILPIGFVKDQMKWILHDVSIETIDNLAKEMVGDT